MKTLKPEDIIKKDNLGKMTVSATGLRRIANAIQKKFKTKGDVKLNSFVCYYSKLKTLGIDL